MRQKVSLAWLSFGECTARVKIELTDFMKMAKQIILAFRSFDNKRLQMRPSFRNKTT